jgi:hypothetical protein
LAAVDGRGISVPDTVRSGFFHVEVHVLTVVGPQCQRLPARSTAVTTARWEVTSLPSPPGARVTTRSPVRWRLPPGQTSSGPDSRPVACIHFRARSLRAATLARLHA